ncbi:MAG TPA: Gfo/Idh/MocA family oxidoreductase [Bryobacteraceae bacterium]|nr:Gfo/Idh/MocA family oxidoreductase [Bryobacteraceae bacterium]
MIPRTLIVGGGMITHDQILPSLLQLQREGVVGDIAVCAQHGRTVRALAEAPQIRQAFPHGRWMAHPALDANPDESHPGLYRELFAAMPPRNVVIVALPDQLHFEAVMAALRADQHVICVKPLVLTASEAEAIEDEARSRRLFVGIEYHKRFDDRSLMARQRYRVGAFGEFRLGSAVLMEKWYYRHSGFRTWFTKDNTDAFTYIGCHYVDLVAFITGLEPVRVSVYGIADRLPGGAEGWLWTDARVIWNNGACLNVQNSLSFPDAAPGSNTQGLTLYCAQGDRGGLLRHSDQYRGLEHIYVTEPSGPGATTYSQPSPDYFQYVYRGGEGLTPVGYGYRSIEHLVRAVLRVEGAVDRAAELRRIDEEGILATPANSRYNEKVIEAARQSIASGGSEVAI